MTQNIIDTESLYRIFLEHPTVTTDSRNCPEGSVFFALKGENFNGNLFAAKALENGCSYAVIDDPSLQTDRRMLLVDNVLNALQDLAAHHRRMLSDIPVICITGTNGKTTTKELTAAVLAQKYNLLYTQGNLNNSIGTPLTLLRLNRSHEVAVIEIGASHPGDIKELVDIAQPDWGLITNVGRAHLEGFGSFEGVIRTKGELYDYLRAHRGKIILNAGNPYLSSLAQGLESVRYTADTSVGGDVSVNGRVIDAAPLSLEWTVGTRRHSVQTHLIGAYNLENALAAITVGIVFGVDEAGIDRALEGYEPSNHRSQLLRTDRNTLIVDAYNANPSSMQAALDNFLPSADASKGVILGSMKELGAYSEEEHRRLVQRISASRLGLAILIGEEFKPFQSEATAEGAPLLWFDSTESCRKWINVHPVEGCTLLLKGSHANHLETLSDIL